MTTQLTNWASSYFSKNFDKKVRVKRSDHVETEKALYGIPKQWLASDNKAQGRHDWQYAGVTYKGLTSPWNFLLISRLWLPLSIQDQ